MPRNTKLSRVAANAEANALAALMNGGYVRIYDGVQPANVDAPAEGRTKLAEMRLSSPAFGPATDGVIKANAILADNKASATGKATWFRCFAADGATAVMDGSVGISGCDLNMNSIAIQADAKVSISAFIHAV